MLKLNKMEGRRSIAVISGAYTGVVDLRWRKLNPKVQTTFKEIIQVITRPLLVERSWKLGDLCVLIKPKAQPWSLASVATRWSHDPLRRPFSQNCCWRGCSKAPPLISNFQPYWPKRRPLSNVRICPSLFPPLAWWRHFAAPRKRWKQYGDVTVEAVFFSWKRLPTLFVAVFREQTCGDCLEDARWAHFFVFCWILVRGSLTVTSAATESLPCVPAPTPPSQIFCFLSLSSSSYSAIWISMTSYVGNWAGRYFPVKNCQPRRGCFRMLFLSEWKLKTAIFFFDVHTIAAKSSPLSWFVQLKEHSG